MTSAEGLPLLSSYTHYSPTNPNSKTVSKETHPISPRGVQGRGAMALVGCGGANRRYLQVSEVYTFALSPGHLLDESTVRE